MVDPALAWSEKLSVEVGGAGTVTQAGVVLPRLLADRLGLCTELAGVMARAGVLSVAASGAGVGGRGVLAGRGRDVSDPNPRVAGRHAPADDDRCPPDLG